MEKNFVNLLVEALIHSIKTILVFIFLLPYKLWVKSAMNLVDQKKRTVIEPTAIDGLWPFLTYLKRFSFDFYFDAASFLSYFIGLLLAFVSLFSGGGFGGFMYVLIMTYFCPLYISFFRDLAQVCLIPFRKFLSWGSKPAQYLEIKNK